jgi:hypothetical protein
MVGKTIDPKQKKRERRNSPRKCENESGTKAINFQSKKREEK